MAEISTGVHQVDGVNSNSYILLEDDGSLTLIDCGISKDGKKILGYIETKLSKQPSDLKRIVITHAHIDHTRGALALKKKTGAKVAIHDKDADFLSGKKKLPSPKGAVGILFRILSPFFRTPTLEAEVRLNENDAVGSSLVVLHTPGHTPGSISLYDRNRKIVFVGDAILTKEGKLEGPPKQFTIDYPQAIASIEKISSLDLEILLSGHGDPIKSSAKKMVKEFFESNEENLKNN